MTEEQALEFWRKLDPIDAVVARCHDLGPNDPLTYEVRCDPRELRDEKFAQVIKLAEAHGLGVSLEIETEHPPWLTFYTPEPEPTHPKASTV